jgi:hypothetical protein
VAVIARREQPPCAQRCRSDLLSETALLRQQELTHHRDLVPVQAMRR